MAAIIPDEGADVILTSVCKGITPATLYLGLFTSSHGATSVPAASASLAAMGSGFAEVSSAAGQWTTYTRMAISSVAWSAFYSDLAWTVTGRFSNPGQLTFPATTGVYTPADPIVGYLIADASTGGHALCYSNFADTIPIPGVSLGDTVKVTPSLGIGN